MSRRKADNPSKNILDHLETVRSNAELQRISAVLARSRALFKPTHRMVTRPPSADTKPWSGEEAGRFTRVHLLSLPCPLDAPCDGVRRMPGSKLRSYNFEHYDLCLRDGSIDEAKLEAYKNSLLELYRRAAHENDIIVANELGFPSFWAGLPAWQHQKERGGAPDKRAHYIERNVVRAMRLSFEDELQKLSTKKNCIIIPGSFHDWNSCENVIPIKFPLETDSVDHVKRTTAKSAGEFIKTSRLRHYPIYNYGRLTFAVLICSDIFDLNIFLRQIKIADKRTELPVVYFVPSCQFEKAGQPNPIREACADLSWATGSVVFFVNQAQHGDAVGGEIFIAGESKQTMLSKDRSQTFVLDEKEAASQRESWLKTLHQSNLMYWLSRHSQLSSA